MRLPRRGRKVSPGESPVPRGRAPGMPGVPQLFPCQEGPVTIGGAEAQDRPICPHLWATKAGPRAHPKLAAAPSAPSLPQAGCRRGRWRRRLGGQHVLGPFRGAPPSGSCQVSERIRLPLPSPPSRWWGARPTRRREVLGATPKKTEQAGGLQAGQAVLHQGEPPYPWGPATLQGSCPQRGPVLYGELLLTHLPSKCSCALAPNQSRPVLTALAGVGGTHLFGQLLPPSLPASLPSPDAPWETKPVFPTSLTGLSPWTAPGASTSVCPD